MKKGIDIIKRYSKLLKGKRLGLITSISGVDNHLISTIEILHKEYELVALFAPEHGARGEREAGGIVEDYIDEATNLPVYSLYREESKKLSKEMLEKVDAVVFDLQDLGVRYYTFISTMIYALYECKKYRKEIIILDRPNPLGGDVVEGTILKKGYESFVGPYVLPARYGLTIGELATLVNEEEKIGCSLIVIPCEGWKRTMNFFETKQIWIMPSLGMPHVNTAFLYTGTCLVEGTNLSEGRGTSCPFEIIGAPYIQAERLVKELRSLNLKGVAFTPAYFKPTTSKYSNEFCQGVHLHITDYKEYESFNTGIYLIETIKKLYSKDFKFLEPLKEGGKPFIDLLYGGKMILDEKHSGKKICIQGYEESREFLRMKEKYHMY